jgi:hypothetical protein
MQIHHTGTDLVDIHIDFGARDVEAKAAQRLRETDVGEEGILAHTRLPVCIPGVIQMEDSSQHLGEEGHMQVIQMRHIRAILRDLLAVCTHVMLGVSMADEMTYKEEERRAVDGDHTQMHRW